MSCRSQYGALALHVTGIFYFFCRRTIWVSIDFHISKKIYISKNGSFPFRRVEVQAETSDTKLETEEETLVSDTSTCAPYSLNGVF